MNKYHRIAAGGVVFKDNKLLMVRYHDATLDSFLVCPGGGLEEDENIIQAIIREVKEETGIAVEPVKVLAIEDLLTGDYKMIKVWMLCDWLAGEILETEEAAKEGIIQAGWFSSEQLSGEVVYPPIITEHDWQLFRSDTWQVECLPSRKTDL
jgi:ADP-ribose pyrophosphatase YjhB (NUDIX family)